MLFILLFYDRWTSFWNYWGEHTILLVFYFFLIFGILVCRWYWRCLVTIGCTVVFVWTNYLIGSSSNALVLIFNGCCITMLNCSSKCWWSWGPWWFASEVSLKSAKNQFAFQDLKVCCYCFLPRYHSTSYYNEMRLHPCLHYTSRHRLLVLVQCFSFLAKFVTNEYMLGVSSSAKHLVIIIPIGIKSE